MTNSMNNVNELKKLVHASFNILEEHITDSYQISFVIEQKEIMTMLATLKNAGWIQLSYLSAVDWPDEEKFELVYIVFNWDKPVYVQIRSKINRIDATTASILPIFPGAKYYERECHEFFGIKFPGNPDYEKQLILENWDDIPPMRKDFDPKAYSDRKFTTREYSETYIVQSEKEPSKKVKRESRKARAESLSGGKKS
jgi:NADH-quinone oxidoreductase subunit C